MTGRINPIDKIFQDLIKNQTAVVDRLAQSEKVGEAADKEIAEAIKELNDMHKKAADDIAATKAKSEPFNSVALESFLEFADELLKTGAITGTVAGAAGVSLKNALVSHKSVIVETNGNRDANMAIASLFSKAEDLDEIVSRASFFAILFFGTTRRILWDDEKAHAAAVKDISESCKGIRKITVGEAVRILKSTSPEPIDKKRLGTSDAFFRLYCYCLKAERLKKEAYGLADGGSGDKPKEQTGSTMVKVPWTPYIGEEILYRRSPHYSWLVGRFCGVSKKNAYIENGVPVKEISPAIKRSILPSRNYLPVFRVNNRRLIQVA